MITNDAGYTREVATRIAIAKSAFCKEKNPFIDQLDLNLREKIVMCYN
jgi:hypothetical protein